MKDDATIGCGISKQISSVVRKWAKEKWNEGVLKQTNNQAFVLVWLDKKSLGFLWCEH